MALPVLPLNEMTAEEKLQTMETIWQSLSANPETVESLEWHRDELRVREAQVASGEATLVDWETTKAEIRGQSS
jgi:putative addiction module component (TIGR02574 family)